MKRQKNLHNMGPWAVKVSLHQNAYYVKTQHKMQCAKHCVNPSQVHGNTASNKTSIYHGISNQLDDNLDGNNPLNVWSMEELNACCTSLFPL